MLGGNCLYLLNVSHMHVSDQGFEFILRYEVHIKVVVVDYPDVVFHLG